MHTLPQAKFQLQIYSWDNDENSLTMYKSYSKAISSVRQTGQKD